MEAVTVPYLPAGLWLMAASLTILILLLVFSYYWYFRKKVETALGKDLKDTGSLAAVKEQLQEDVKELRRWIADHQDELLKLLAERKDWSLIKDQINLLSHIKNCFTVIDDPDSQPMQKNIKFKG